MDFNLVPRYNRPTRNWRLPQGNEVKLVQSSMEPDLDKDIREAEEALREWERPALAPEALICECYCVSVADIRNTCAAARFVDMELLTQKFGMGTGCGRCVKEQNSWKDLIFK